MDPFSITCTTCKSRLKVRDESAIGQILACPKCGGLVMVKRPAEGEAPASDSAETRPDLSTLKPRPAPLPLRPGDTLPAGAFDEIDSILSDAPPRPRDPLPGGSKKARVSINDAAGQSAITLSSQAAKKQSPNRPAETARSGDVKDAAATAPSASSSSILSSGPVAGGSSLIAGSGKSGSKVKAGLSGVKGPAAAAAAVTQAVGIDPHPQAAANPLPAAVPSATPADGPAPYPFSSEQDPVPPTPAPKHVWWHLPLLVGSIAAGILLAVGVVLIAVTVLRDDSSLLASNPVKSQPVSAEPLTDPSSPSGDQSAGSDEDIQAPAADSSTEPASTTDEQPANDSPATQEAPPANATVADAGPGGDKTAKSPPPAPPGDNDPLGIVPAPRDGNRPAADTALADPLGKFGNLIESPAADPIPLEQTGASPAIDIPADTADASASRPPLPRPEPRDVDVTARLADQFPAIDVSGVPLVDFLQFAQDFSTVPITLEPDALWFARASAGSPVNVRGENISVGETLARGLKPLGLQYTIEDGSIRVGVAEVSPPTKIQYPIKDLAAGDDDQANALAEWMQSLVHPSSWGEGGGNLTVGAETIATQQTRRVHADLLSLFERLRTARGLNPISRYDRANFTLKTRLEQAKPKLDTPITLNYSQGAPLTKIVERLEEAAGVRILIDWESLAPVGWNPDGEAVLLANKQPLRETLTALVEPMELAWRAIDGNTLQILSPQALQQRTELEFYPLGDLAVADEGESLLARLKTTLGEELFRDSGGPCDLRYDAESKHLLASLPQPLQKKLADAIAELQKGAASAVSAAPAP